MNGNHHHYINNSIAADSCLKILIHIKCQKMYAHNLFSEKFSPCVRIIDCGAVQYSINTSTKAKIFGFDIHFPKKTK